MYLCMKVYQNLELDFSKYGSRMQQIIPMKLLNYIPRATGQNFKYVNFDPSVRLDTIKQAH